MMDEEKETTDERMEWKLRRVGKRIKLKGELEKVTGVSYNMLSLHENGRANLDPEKLIKYKQYIKEHK